MDLTSPDQGAGGTLELNSDVMTIDGRKTNPQTNDIAYGSENDGVILVTDTATFVLDADLTNIGTFEPRMPSDPGATTDFSTVGINDELRLSGQGTVVAYGADVWDTDPEDGPSGFGAPAGAELRNVDNTIEGGGPFNVGLLNQASVEADSPSAMVFRAPVTNIGTMKAVGCGSSKPGISKGGTFYSDMDTTINNYQAGLSSTVIIETGQTILGARLQVDWRQFFSTGIFDAEGTVTLAGGSISVVVAGRACWRR